MKSLTAINSNIHHQLTEGGIPVAVSSIDKTLPSVDSCIQLTCIIYGSQSSRTKSPTTVDIACIASVFSLNISREERTHKIEVIIHVCNAYSIPDVCIILWSISVSGESSLIIKIVWCDPSLHEKARCDGRIVHGMIQVEVVTSNHIDILTSWCTQAL